METWQDSNAAAKTYYHTKQFPPRNHNTSSTDVPNENKQAEKDIGRATAIENLPNLKSSNAQLLKNQTKVKSEKDEGNDRNSASTEQTNTKQVHNKHIALKLPPANEFAQNIEEKNDLFATTAKYHTDNSRNPHNNCNQRKLSIPSFNCSGTLQKQNPSIVKNTYFYGEPKYARQDINVARDNDICR